MAEVTRAGAGGRGSDRASLKARAVERMARAIAGERLDALQHRLEVLEAEVQECRQLNLRLAELTDVVAELLLPVAQRDEARIAEAFERFDRSVGVPPQ